MTPPRAYVVVDGTSGVVLDAHNDRTPLPPASLTKVFTALAAVAALPPDAGVPVSGRAAAMPARKINMHAGEVWDLEDTLHSLLLSSANDAGAALAERISGSLDEFEVALGKLATHLGLADSPVLRDPSGLDDDQSVGGGNLVSARDLVIAGRALLAEPRLAPIVATPVYTFTDPRGVARKLGNHNKLLSRYPGSIGLKTGFTKKAGRGLLAAATRDGRTTIVAVVGADDTYGWAARLLDAAFARPVSSAGERLPAVPPPLTLRAVGPGSAKAQTVATATAPPATSVVADALAPATTPAVAGSPTADSNFGLNLARGGIALVGVVGALRARVRVRRWRRRRQRAAARVRPGIVRRRPTQLTPHHRPSPELAERFHAISRD